MDSIDKDLDMDSKGMPLVKRPWSPEEDEALLAAVQK